MAYGLWNTGVEHWEKCLVNNYLFAWVNLDTILTVKLIGILSAPNYMHQNNCALRQWVAEIDPLCLCRLIWKGVYVQRKKEEEREREIESNPFQSIIRNYMHNSYSSFFVWTTFSFSFSVFVFFCCLWFKENSLCSLTLYLQVKSFLKSTTWSNFW